VAVACAMTQPPPVHFSTNFVFDASWNAHTSIGSTITAERLREVEAER